MPIVNLMPDIRLDRSEPKEFVVNTHDIAQGNIEYQVNRAKTIATGMQSQDTWSGMNTRTGMQKMGADLQDGTVAKDEAWWQKALGVLDPLKYLEIPVELAAEALFDPISWATGRDLSWVRGTAEREQFEAWKALGRDDPNKAGWGEVFSRADKAFDAFDKRPMVAQIALAGVQIAATGGTSLALKAAQISGAGARTIAMARSARIAAFVIDPWEIGWHGAKLGVKGARHITKTRTAADGTHAGLNTAFEQQVAGVQRPTRPVQDFWEFDETGKIIETNVPTVPRILTDKKIIVLDERGIPLPTPQDASHPAANFPRQIDAMKNTPSQALANQFWSTFQPRYDINGNGVMGTVMAGDGPISPHVFFRGAEESGRLSPVLESGNTIRHFVYDRYQEAMAAPAGSYERVEALREMAVTQMNLSMGSRHGQTFTATKDALWGAENSFLETNLLKYHDEANGNTAGLFALDQGEAYTAIRMYKEALEEWGSRSGMVSDWIDDTDQIFSFRVDKDGNGVFDQSLDKLDEVAEVVADASGKTKKTGKNIKVVKKRGNKETDSDIGFSGNLNEILKKYRLSTDEQGSLLYPQYQNMPTSAKDFRSHRATEMHLEGKSSSYIQQLLNHAENSTTISYIRDVGSIGAGTLPFQVLSKASHTVAVVADMESKFGAPLQNATKQLQEAVKGTPVQRAKGAKEGGFEEDVHALRLGESMMYSDEGRKILEEYLPEYAHDLVGKGDDLVFKPAGVSPEQVGREVQMLLAMTRLGDEIGTAAEYARDIAPAVYKSISRSQYEKIGIHGGSLQTPGILNRAGYYTEGTGRNKVIKWAGDIKFKGKDKYGKDLTEINREAWTTRRANYGKEAQIYEDINWDEWAAAQYSKVKEADDLWNGLRMPAGFNKDGSVKYSKYRVHHLLGEYVDMKAWELLYQWDEIPLAQKSHISRDIDGLLQSLVSGGMGPSMKNMSTRQYKKVGAHIFAELERVKWAVRSADEINGLWREARGGQYAKVERGPAVDEAVEKVSRMPIQDIESWLHNPDVISTLGIHRIDANTTPTKMKEKFRTIAAKAPRIFGEDFAKFSQKGTTKEELLRSGQKANFFLDMLSDRLLNNKHLMEHLTANAKKEFATINERVASIQQGRMRSLDAGVATDRMAELGFVSPHNLNRVKSHQHQTERILESRDGAIQQWLNKKDNFFMQSIKALYKVGHQAATGGQAGIAHPLTRGLSGRAQAFTEIDSLAHNVGLVTHSVAVKMLGLSSIEPRRALKLLGIKKGHEFFGDANNYRLNANYGPQPKPRDTHGGVLSAGTGKSYSAAKGIELQDFDDIMKWEKNEGYKHYHEYAKGNDNGAALHRLMTEMADDQDMAMKYLTQVDMVLERIAPEHWDKYFKLTDDQRHALVYIKDMQFQVDEFARQRGLNIPGAIQDKGASYLIRYFPRLYQQENLRRLSDKTAKDSMLTSGGGATNSVFQKRDDTLSDIVDVLGYGAGKKQALGDTELTAAKYMLDDIGTRMQVYAEVIHKEVVDQDTVKWLHNQPEFKAAAASTNAREAEYKALSAMETLINATSDSVIAEVREHGQLSAAQKLSYQWKHQILNNDDILKMNAFYTEGGAWDLPFGQSLITRIGSPLPRDAAWVRENFDEISGFVAERKAILEETHAGLRERRFREKTKDDAWITKTLNSLDSRQRDAVTQHLVAAGTFWGDPLRWTANILKRPTETLRYFKSGLDLGAPMIHGFNALVRLPVGREGFDMKSQAAWLDGVKMMGKFFAQPEMYDQWAIDNMDRVGDARQWVRLGNPEPLYIADSDAMRNVRSWASDQKWSQNKHMKFLSRFEAGFTGYLDVMRVNLWDSMKSVVDSELLTTGKNLAPDALDQLRRKKYHELGAVINKMTGAFDPHLAQQTPFQSLIENSLVFFAPMYRRATFGIMADIGRGNQRSEQAVRTLGGVLVAGMMMQQLAVMTGNSSGDMFDPEGEKGKGEGALDLTHSFGKIKVGGMQMGIGTAWWTVFRMASDVAMMSYHDDDVDLDRDSWADNPVMEMFGRRGRSQLAPGTALLTDLITGRNFIGEPLRDEDENNWAAMGQHIGRSAVPFWLDGAMSGGSVAGGALGMASEFLGLQAYEVSSYDNLSAARHQVVNTWMDNEDIIEWRKEQNKKGEPINYISLPSILKAKLNSQNPTVRMLLEEHNENYGAVARGAGKVFYEYNQKKRNHDNEINKSLATISRQVETGTKSYQDLQNAISNAKFAKRHFNNALLVEYPELVEHFADLRIGRSTSDLIFQGDIVYDQWASLRNSEEFIDVEGVFNYEAMLSEETSFWADSKNSDHKEYVEEKHRKWTEHLPTVRKFEEAKDYLQRNNYWNMHDLLWTPGTMMHAKAKLYLKRPRVYREAMKRTDNTYVTIEKALQRKRLDMLTKDSYMDEILVTYYGNNPVHQRNQGLKERLIRGTLGASPITPRQDRFTISTAGITTIIPEGATN